ncbi:hypothetical protein IFM89_009590, partial [Coptis chinensis]
MFLASLSSSLALADEEVPRLSKSVMVPVPAHGMPRNITEEEKEFWKQPDNGVYRPCLEFGIEYRRASAKISKEKRRFLIVVVSGGLNQQRNQIVDAVVIARILEAALVIPVLKVNFIWGDERQSIEGKIPHDVTPQWIHTKFFKQLNEEGVLVLKGLDSKLLKNLPSDLQKLRCKVAFHALRFSGPIREVGDKLARRMWIEGPYIGLHLRLEKDVWLRTGCRTGLGPKFDSVIAEERKSNPEFLTGRLNMTYDQRRLAGLCPAQEVARLLKALGAPRSARLFAAGGVPLGGSEALQPLKEEFPDLVTKEILAKEGELAPYVNRSSALAAIDYIISLSSDVFMPSHGGNTGRVMQGHRAYIGHRKYIKPNKRAMLPFFEDPSILEPEFEKVMRRLHKDSLAPPELRDNKRGRDAI